MKSCFVVSNQHVAPRTNQPSKLFCFVAVICMKPSATKRRFLSTTNRTTTMLLFVFTSISCDTAQTFYMPISGFKARKSSTLWIFIAPFLHAMPHVFANLQSMFSSVPSRISIELLPGHLCSPNKENCSSRLRTSSAALRSLSSISSVRYLRRYGEGVPEKVSLKKSVGRLIATK